MTDLQANSFDYSSLDNETAEYLKDRENSMARTLEKTSEKIGEDLYKAQQKLANYGNGKFEEWFTSLGFKKTNVYDYIKRYKFVRQLNEPDDIKQFQQLPVKLQNEISKPSANTELNQKVFDGDITTHKEYKEQEKIIKEQAERIEELENKKPEIIEKEITKEVVPHDYDGLKSDNEQLSQALKEAQQETERIKMRNDHIEKERDDLKRKIDEMPDKNKEFDRMTEELRNLNGQLTEGQKQLKAQKEVYELIRDSNQMLETLAPVPYLIDVEYVKDNEYAVKALKKTMKSVELWLDNMGRLLEEQTIIEGEFINE